MAENHYVDAVDQHEAATGVADQSDLTTNYAVAKKPVLGPWMQEEARQATMKKERDDVRKKLRKSSFWIGLSISLPVIIGILFGQYALKHVNRNDAGATIFILIAVGVVLALLIIVLFRYVFMAFSRYSIKALPITVTTLGVLFLVAQRLFNLYNGVVGGLQGYAAGLLSLIIIGIVVASLAIFSWTSPKIHPLLKIFILIIFLGVAAGVGFLA